jgi:hypothetical protein
VVEFACALIFRAQCLPKPIQAYDWALKCLQCHPLNLVRPSSYCCVVRLNRASDAFLLSRLEYRLILKHRTAFNISVGSLYFLNHIPQFPTERLSRSPAAGLKFLAQPTVWHSILRSSCSSCVNTQSSGLSRETDTV